VLALDLLSRGIRHDPENVIPGDAWSRDPLADHLITPQNAALLLIESHPLNYWV
jgi:hypothetical protein